jgi:glutathione S-transferase
MKKMRSTKRGDDQPMIKLLGRADSSNVRKVLWALDELGLAYEREDYGGSFGRVDTPDYLRLNPNGLVPTLIDGDVVIWESNTIVRYLAERQGASAFGGETAAARARISQWMDWQLSSLNAPIHSLFLQLIRLAADKRDQRVIDANLETVQKKLSILNSGLPKTGFLTGANVTAADVVIGVMLHRFFSLVAAPSVDPRVVQYHRDLAARPGFKAHVAIGKP